MSASQAKLSLLLPFSHDGAPARHHGLPVSPTFRRPIARVGLGEQEEEEEAQQGGGSDLHRAVDTTTQQQPAGASADEGEGSSDTGAAVEEQQSPSHTLSPATAEIFTHDEIVCLRLIFALFDDNGDDFVDQGELLRYAEETGARAVCFAHVVVGLLVDYSDLLMIHDTLHPFIGPAQATTPRSTRPRNASACWTWTGTGASGSGTTSTLRRGKTFFGENGRVCSNHESLVMF